MNKTKLPIEALFPKLMRVASAKTQNDADAADLVSDTVLAALRAEAAGIVIENPEAYLMRTLQNKFHDRLRLKYSVTIMSIDDDAIPDFAAEDGNPEETLLSEETAEEVRREVAFLAKAYREAIVRFYLRGESVETIADALSVPRGTVKSRLDTGRKTLRKELIMKNFDTQSYEPRRLAIGISGAAGFGGTPFSLIDNDVLAQNVLLYAYEKPLSVTEIAKGLGVPAGYVEPILEKLVHGELMGKTDGGKYYADLIIYQNQSAYFEPQKRFAEKYAQAAKEILRPAIEKLLALPFLADRSESVRQSAVSYFTLKALMDVYFSLEKKVFTDTKYEDYPNRPGDGKWYAMGFVCEEAYRELHARTYVDGPTGTTIVTENGQITLSAMDSPLGGTYHYHRLNPAETIRLLLAVKDGSVEALDTHILGEIDRLCRLHILSREENGALHVEVPIFTKDENRSFWALVRETTKALIDLYGAEFMTLICENRIETPPHVKSVAEYMHYLPVYEKIPMCLIYEMADDGLFPIEMRDADGKFAAPAMILYEK